MWTIWKKITGQKLFDIKLKQNDEIETILKKLRSLESLGDVTVVKTETDLNRETSLIDDDDEIRIIDLEGNTLKSIQVESESYLYNLVYCNDRVIYSDWIGKAVYCYDESGKQIWRYTQDLSGPKGLCTDTYGNIIVADYNSDRIIVISKDGQNSKVLISEEDGLKGPRCICFKHNESSGFICNFNGTYLAKFNLSSG
ncbi:TRIM2_3 [Mytilus edulis]|uniref:TRIM2_3 n=1 Tax=Mytilus edulis TaxID=6550 RepID=A0A8S3U0F2_MYTED|nr:TRIM2_3 [Mytilus edulis]